MRVALVVLDGVGKTFRGRTGAWEAVKGFSLDMAEGEFFCLLGTCGCGKTTVLNMVAGFEAPSAGDIRSAASRCAAPARTAAWSSRATTALYGWLSALGNVEFGLRMRGMPRRERRERREHYLELVGLTGQEHKHPAELSRRHEAAHPDRPRAGQRAADAADGRALRRAGCP